MLTAQTEGTDDGVITAPRFIGDEVQRQHYRKTSHTSHDQRDLRDQMQAQQKCELPAGFEPVPCGFTVLRSIYR